MNIKNSKIVDKMYTYNWDIEEVSHCLKEKFPNAKNITITDANQIALYIDVDGIKYVSDIELNITEA